MTKLFVLLLAQTVHHEVIRTSPDEVSAFVRLENGTADPLREVRIWTFVGPPAQFLQGFPQPTGIYQVPQFGGAVRFYERALLPPQTQTVVREDVALPLGANWAHHAIIDATNQRTGARLCETRVTGPGPLGIPTMSYAGLSVLALALAGGMFLLRRVRPR